MLAWENLCLLGLDDAYIEPCKHHASIDFDLT